MHRDSRRGLRALGIRCSRLTDVGLHKDFSVTETMKLSFRTEAFNLLNKTNFGPPNGTRSSGGFGTITNAYPARQMQFGLKLLF